MLFYITIFLLFFSIEYVYVLLARKLRIVDVPHHQSSHRGVIVRGGGFLFYFAFFIWSIFAGIPYIWALLGLSILAGISFWDDVHDVSPKVRLVCQFVAIMLMLYQSPLFVQPKHVVVLLAIACVGMVNIYNFMDGINGMTGGYSLVVALALLYVNKYKINFVDGNLLMFVVLSILVFCFFNFRRRARCFAGDVGSLSMGFIIVFLVLELALTAKSMSWMVFLSVYAVDGGLTLLHRVILKENLLKPHKKHAYQIMANELGISHLVVSGIYMGLQTACCVWFIAYPGYLTLSFQVALLVSAYLLFIKKYYHLHVDNPQKWEGLC